MGLLCAEQDLGNLDKITFNNSGTPVCRTRRRKSQEMHFQEFWDSCAQNKTSEISKNEHMWAHIWNTFENTCGRQLRVPRHLLPTFGVWAGHFWENTCGRQLRVPRHFFVNICCLGNWALGLGEPFPGRGGTGSPGRLQPISILDCKNPKSKPGWGKIMSAQQVAGDRLARQGAAS